LQDLTTPDEFKLISDYVAEISGIVIPPEKYYLIETRFYKLMLDAGAESFDEFYQKVILPGDPQIAQKIINAITVNETLWFRDAVLWKCFERDVLPALVDKLISGKKESIRIWSSAASTGQEAYSIAMCIDNYLKRNRITDISLSNFDILATDISSRVIEIARAGRYDKVSMTRGLSEHYKAAYFQPDGSAWDIDPAIKKAVRLFNFNLHDSYAHFKKFDVVFCRYVLIYFPNTLKAGIIKKMHDVLTDDGVFFTGIYVLFDMLKDVFNVKTFENLTYYTKPRTQGITDK